MGFFGLGKKSEPIVRVEDISIKKLYDWPTLVNHTMNGIGTRRTFDGKLRGKAVKVMFTNLNNVLTEREFKTIIRQPEIEGYDDTHIDMLVRIVEGFVQDPNNIEIWAFADYPNIDIMNLDINMAFNQVVRDINNIITLNFNKATREVNQILTEFEKNYPGQGMELRDEYNLLMENINNFKDDLLKLK